MLPVHVASTILLLVAWDLFAVFTCILFFLHRDVPLIFHRNVPLTLAVAICGTFLINLHLIRLIVRPNFPCFLILWIPAFVLPVFIFTLLTRFIFLAREYWLNRYNLAVNDAMYTVIEGQLTRKNSITYEDTSTYRWRLRLSGLFNLTSILALGVFFVACQTVGMIVVSLNSTVYTWGVTKCNIGYELLFLYGWAVGAMLLIPIAAILMIGVEENYGIKLELYASSLVFFTLALLGVVLDFTPMTLTALKRFRHSVGSHHLLMFSLVFIHVMFIVVPAIKVWREEHRKLHGSPKEKAAEYVDPQLESAEYTRDALHALFEDETRMAEFRRFAVLDFSVKQLIFYKRWKEAKDLSEMGGYWQQQYKQLYDEFLAPDSANLLEVSEAATKHLPKQFADERYTSDMLDRAAGEVFDTIFAESFPKFLNVSKRSKSMGAF